MINEQLIQVAIKNDTFEISSPLYYILLFEAKSVFTIDLVSYHAVPNRVVFLSPYQHFQLTDILETSIQSLSFHADFYCIEYHKKEVACNGILFNNIYETPYVDLNTEEFMEVKSIFKKISLLQNVHASYEISLKKAYLQLALALCSKQKQLTLSVRNTSIPSEFSNFRALIEQHFIKERTISFYAQKYQLSNEAFSKKIKSLYGKPPSVLIKERLILEAKKMLHLSYKNINEIAFELGFTDEFHFSKYFKNEVGIAPKGYRENVGISIVAK